MRTFFSIVGAVVLVLSVGTGVAVVASMVFWLFLTANGANPFQ